MLREGHPDIGSEARVQTLGAFANHAALTAANARLYAELESALARQIDLNRQKGDFVATVSHELRTPLAVMLAATHTLRKLADRIPEQKRLDLLDASIEQGNRLQRLIDELLLVAAAEHDHADAVYCETDLDALVTEIEREMRPITEGRLRIHSEQPVGRVAADPDRLRQILLNLVDNASKYAPEGPIELDISVTGTDVALRAGRPWSGHRRRRPGTGLRTVRPTRPVVDPAAGRHRPRALPLPPARIAARGRLDPRGGARGRLLFHAHADRSGR